MLLAAGADPNFTVRTGLMSTSSPLVTAACRAHTSVIDSLLEHPDILVNMPVSGGIQVFQQGMGGVQGRGRAVVKA